MILPLQDVLVKSQVVNANPSDSQVYPPLSLSNRTFKWLLSLQYKENKGKFAASNGHLKAKSFSASGGLHPLTRTRGSAPGPRWGFAPRPCTRHKRPLFDPPLFVTFRSPWQVGNVVASSQLRSYSTSSPVNTRMGDCDRVRLLALYFNI